MYEHQRRILCLPFVYWHSNRFPHIFVHLLCGITACHRFTNPLLQHTTYDDLTDVALINQCTASSYLCICIYTIWSNLHKTGCVICLRLSHKLLSVCSVFWPQSRLFSENLWTEIEAPDNCLQLDSDYITNDEWRTTSANGVRRYPERVNELVYTVHTYNNYFSHKWRAVDEYETIVGKINVFKSRPINGRVCEAQATTRGRRGETMS